MGLLADAIREHLDLMRRRGADPTEIERLEREALGPVRRGPRSPKPNGVETSTEGPGGPDREASLGVDELAASRPTPSGSAGHADPG